MCITDPFHVFLAGLPEGGSRVEADISDSFFAAVGESLKGHFRVALDIVRLGRGFTVAVKAEGTAVAPCDACLADVEVPVSNECTFTLSLDDLGADESVRVDGRTAMADLSWAVYETIALGMPTRVAHVEGGCDSTMSEILRSHSGRAEEGEGNSPWAELRKITQNNQSITQDGTS